MKKFTVIIVILSMLLTFVFTACGGSSETGTAEPTEQATQKPSDNTEAPAATTEPTAEPTPTPTPEPTPEPGPVPVTLVNSPDSTGNTNYAACHYGLHIAYGNDLVTFMNYTTMFQHGDDHTSNPVKVEGVEFQAEDLQFFNGMLYFLGYDMNNGVYHLYKYDYENPPVRVGDTSVYHYEFINGTIYFRKEFVQGPIYSMNPDGSGETQVSGYLAHGFVHSGQSIFYYSTEVGTAPGLVEINLATGEENVAVFPFYSHNFIAYEGYIYYSLDTGTFRSIHRVSLADQTIEDIWTEIPDFTISLNISDAALYLLVGDSVYKSSLDGSNRTKILEAEDNLKTGLYIFGDRIYCMDDSYVYCQKTDGSEVSMFSWNTLK